MDIYYEGILIRISIREPLCLGDKPIVGTLKDPDEGYGPSYTGALGFPKKESYIRIHAFMNSMPKRKTFDYVYVNKLNIITTICFYETLVRFSFMLSV